MNGPEHYAEAERLLEAATDGLRIAIHEIGTEEALDDALAAQRDAAVVGQVHATLALVAAASESTYRSGDRERWADVLASPAEVTTP